MLSLLGLALMTTACLTSCRKDVTIPTKPRNNADQNLEKRIRDFYSKMKSIHDGRNSFKNGKVTDDVYISVDSAEFLIEATYNYEVASVDDDSSGVAYGEFSFVGAITNDSILSESEASAFMYQIKDSLMSVYDTISYANKALCLFDLEIDHTGGNNQAVFLVRYSIRIEAAPKPQVTIIPGDEYDAWATLEAVCPGAAKVLPFPTQATLSSGTRMNAYVLGRAMGSLTYGPNSALQNCGHPGAAAELRRYGINNYKANNAYISPGFLMAGIKLVKPTFHEGNLGLGGIFDYKTRSFSAYQNYNQFHVTVPDNSGQPSIVGNDFFIQWLNTPMMNFYLNAIPGRINTNKPSGKTFYDFQILLEHVGGVSGSNHWYYHIYYYYYGSETTIPVNQGPLELF